MDTQGNIQPLEIRGEVLTPESPAYDRCRAVWNGMIERRPALIARCRDEDDVAAAVRHARARGLPLAVRGGGHNIAGLGTCEGGLVVDLSEMRAVQVDGATRRAHVQGGALLADVDRETQRHGLAVPGGIISSTGIGGLSLGGGIGWLSRLHGLTLDNLISARVVGADGQRWTASADEHVDLFWGLRGGGGNFGVVTELTFALHPVGPRVLFGPTVFALRDAPAVLRAYRSFAARAPRAACVWADLLMAPPLPFLPAAVHGTPALSLLQCWAGDPADGRRALAALHEVATPLGDTLQLRPYTEAQAMFDGAFGPGMRNYWTADNLDALGDAVIELVVDAAGDLPTPTSDIMIHQLGGAIDDVPLGETAYPHRGVPFAITPGARWQAPEDDQRCVAWTRALQARLRPHATGRAYANFIADSDGSEWTAYAEQLERLRTVKRRYDPDNQFRINHNVVP